MLTNFKTIRKSIARLKELEEITADEARGDYTKKEILGLSRERDKLNRTLGGIKDMESLPDAVFVVDVGHEEIAVREAVKLGIPIVAVVDTNSSPDEIDFVVPGNDDAMRAIRLYAQGAAEAVLAGKSSIPDVPVGDDEFVELDAEGRPKVAGSKRPGRGGPRKRPARKAVVRKKQSRLSAVPDADAEKAPSGDAEKAEAAAADDAAKAGPEAAEKAEPAVEETAEAQAAESSAEEATPAETPDADAAEAAGSDGDDAGAADSDAAAAEAAGAAEEATDAGDADSAQAAESDDGKTE